MEKSKKRSRPTTFIEPLCQLCPFHLGGKHSAAECRPLKERGFAPKADKGKPKDKVDDDQDD
jgi:hypothetical protein